MQAVKNKGKNRYIIVGIGAPGKYVREHLYTSFGDSSAISFQAFGSFSEFSFESTVWSEKTVALYLVIQPGDGSDEGFISELESFISRTGIAVYVIANYPFLWEGRVRIGAADQLLQDLSRVCDAIFRIESHQWFPLKEQVGFHKVVEMVHQVAADVLVSLLESRAQDIDICDLDRISFGKKAKAAKQSKGLWNVIRNF